MKKTASQDDINKAFRKKSRLLHPDKAKQSFIASRAHATPKLNILGQQKKPGVHVSKGPSDSEIRDVVKKASERFARLGVIASILKGSERERYDHFLSNGFPAWKGTGYYYARYRPGLGSVLVGLFTIGGGFVHYGAMYLSWRRQRDFVERYIRHARRAAWGDESGIQGIPGIDGVGAPTPSTSTLDDGNAPLNRRQKRMQEKENKKEKEKDKKRARPTHANGSTPAPEAESRHFPQGPKKRVVAENGKQLIVDSVGNVFLEEEDEHGAKGEYLLNPDEIVKPTFRQTVLFRLPLWIFTNVKNRFWGSTSGEDTPGINGSEVTASNNT